MAETLSNLCSKSIQDDELNTVVIAEELIDGVEGEEAWFGLLGKLYSKKQPNLEGLRNAFIQHGDWKMGCLSGSIPFDMCPFWVHIFKLPLKMMTEKVGIALGESMGADAVLDVYLSSGRYLRVRVEINVLVPLKDFTKVSTPSGEIEVEFRYEKMLAYCRIVVWSFIVLWR
ncbi:hypothetical protein COLO4_13029 [Corchorus olitorius]|uniref:DUF4283 domain-containing protein n=1 Tax=Corchorus olitorius TaxID=93759 RepID=A0A1R3JYJ5_9ROSI|nr:hypothetical protein COLO4_13029 [Corchorus olitorius]